MNMVSSSRVGGRRLLAIYMGLGGPCIAEGWQLLVQAILAQTWWLRRGFPAGRVGPERTERTNHQICAVLSAVSGAEG